jgi:hypothetical protein
LAVFAVIGKTGNNSAVAIHERTQALQLFDGIGESGSKPLVVILDNLSVHTAN